MSGSARAGALRHYLPEPSRLWICQAPLVWPGAEGLWIHLSERSLGGGRPGELPAITPGGPSDLVYLPPTDSRLEAQRRALVQSLEGALVPVVGQWRPGEERRAGEGDVLDPLEVLLLGGAVGLRDLETTCKVAVWPLISGLTDDPEQWRLGVEMLGRAGVRTIVPLSLELGPAERRQLAEYTDETGYQALFHGGAPDERAFSQVVARGGLGSLPPRPQMAASPRLQFNRHAAAELAQAADLWLRLGRSEAAGQELLRAARWLERSAQDLRALVREGNLEILPWLDSHSRTVVEELARGGESSLRKSLEAEYVGSDGAR